MSVILSDLPFKKGHPRFTTIYRFKPLIGHRGQLELCAYISLKCCVKSCKIRVYSSYCMNLTRMTLHFIPKKI